MNSPKTNNGALRAFCDCKMEIDTAIRRITSLSEDRFGIADDDVTWGHVGVLTTYLETLTRITDMAFKEGEHAE